MKKIQYILGVFCLVLSFTACPSPDSGNDGTVTFAIGDIGPSGVGLVFYTTDGGLHGLEVAPEDQRPSGGAPWSTLTGTALGITSASIGTGKANTDAIIAQHGAGGDSAAKACREYTGGNKNDWYLPSQNELNAVWENLVRMEKTGGGWENSGTGSFIDAYYWCSTEYDANKGREQYFYNGQQNYDTKTYSTRVRAIRSF